MVKQNKTPREHVEEVVGIIGGLAVFAWFSITFLDFDKMLELLSI